jgi:hypothetical protein
MILGGSALDRLVRKKLANRDVADPLVAYRDALRSCREEYPGVARAAADGFIEANDFATLSLLVPAVAGEIEQGRYSHLDKMIGRYY